MGRRALDLRGKTFGRYRALNPSMFRNESGEILWRCRNGSGSVVLVCTSVLTRKKKLNKERKD